MTQFALTIKSRVVITPHVTRVRLVPPPGGGGSYDAMKFFKDYCGKTGTIVGYAVTYAGIFDHRGRAPGKHVDIEGYPGNEEAFTPLLVLFDGENTPRSVMIVHLAVIEGHRVPTDQDTDLMKTHGRLGELPEKIELYPDDLVCLRSDLLKTPRRVMRSEFEDDGSVKYALQHTDEEVEAIKMKENADSEARFRARILSELSFPARYQKIGDLELIRRGNIFHLHHGAPEDLTFSSLQEEAAFWSDLSVASLIRKRTEPWQQDIVQTLPDAIAGVKRGEADAIYHLKYMHPVTYDTMRLHPKFSRFSERAQKTTLAYWQSQIAKESTKV